MKFEIDIRAQTSLDQLAKRAESKAFCTRVPEQICTPAISRSGLPWESWELDETFFRALSSWTLDHPETSLDHLLDKITAGIETSKDIFALIPDQPFPARGLVTAIAHLFTLSVLISRASTEVYTFAKGILQWVIHVKSTFNSTPDGRFSRVAWRNLAHMRELIDEICKWAAARLQDGRWLRVKHGLIIHKEIAEFKVRIQDVQRLFMDLSILNLSLGADELKRDIHDLFTNQELAITLEIKKIKTTQAEQLVHIVAEMDEQKQIVGRHKFLLETLVPHTVDNPTYIHQGKQPCDAGTRVSILNDIIRWIYDITPGSSNFLWLTGDPGCGKSAITASIARECKDKRILWAQFFINRKNDATTKPTAYFPSIARQLAERSPEVQRLVHDALIGQPSLVDDIDLDQATKLFVDAVGVACFLDKKSPVVMVIDALDETDRARLKETATVFSQLFKALSEYPNAKVFISSRTEDDISSPFSRTIHNKHVKHIHLDTFAQSSIDDVGIYLKRRLVQIVDENNLNWEVWPGDERLQKLINRSSGLFIWAVTATRFIQQQIETLGTECLDDVLDLLNTENVADVNVLYNTILCLVYPPVSSDWEYEKFRRIVGAIVVLREPLSLAELGSLLDLRRTPTSSPVDIVTFVRRLRTLLAAGTEAITPKTIPRLHKSFFEFITSERVDSRFRIDEEDTRLKLVHQPLGLPSRLENFRVYSSKWESISQWLDANEIDLRAYIYSQGEFTPEDKAFCISCVQSPGVIYKRAIIYIYKLLKADGANNRAVADRLDELKGCVQKWSSWDVTKFITQSSIVREYINALPGWKGEEDFRRTAKLDTDFMCAHLYLILYDRKQYQKLVGEPKAQIQAVLNLLQGMLDSQTLDIAFRGPFLESMIKISMETSLHPEGLIQHDVTLQNEPIYSGIFRAIWGGTYRGKFIAVKTPSVYAHRNNGENLEFVREGLLWRQLHHRNILPLLGIFHGESDHARIGLMSPWMKNGDIMNFLHSNPDADRVSLARDVVMGLEYLHTMQPSIVHGELKTANILITDTHRACIIDFRLSKGYQSEMLDLSLPSLRAETSSLRFMAPELLTGGERIDCTIGSDIYALGCVFYSVFCGEWPFYDVKSDYAVIKQVVQGKYSIRPTQCAPMGASCESLGLDDRMWGILEDCWLRDPLIRPSTSEILERFPVVSTPENI